MFNPNPIYPAAGMAPAPATPIMPAQVPGVGGGFYQQPMMGAMPFNGGPEVKGHSILPEEDRKLLQNKSRPTITVSDETFAKTLCDHKTPDGVISATMDTATGLIHCDLCGNTFRIATADKDTCKNAIETLACIWETTKLLNINVSADVMRQLGSAIAVVANVLPTVYTSVYTNWMQAYKTGMRQYQGGNPYYGNSMYQYGNSADALSAMQYGGASYNYMPAAQQTYPYQQYAGGYNNPYAAQFAMGMQQPVQQPAMGMQQYAAYQPAASAGGPNPFCNNTPNYAAPAAQQAYPYPQNVAAPAAPAYNNGAIDPAMIMRGMPAAAQQAAAPVNIPGAAPAPQAAPVAPAAPAQAAPKPEGKFDV